MIRYAGIAAALIGGALLAQPASAERICKQECVGPICKEKCVERDATVGVAPGVVIEERDRRPHRDEPGVNIRVPDVDVRIK